jgi:hypothetical protein
MGDANLAPNMKLCQVFLFNDSLMIAKQNSDKSLEVVESLLPIESIQIEHSIIDNGTLTASVTLVYHH